MICVTLGKLLNLFECLCLYINKNNKTTYLISLYEDQNGEFIESKIKAHSVNVKHWYYGPAVESNFNLTQSNSTPLNL